MNASQSPWFRSGKGSIAESDTVILLTQDQKRFLLRTQHGGTLHTHLGVFRHVDMMEAQIGDIILSQKGHPGLLLEPSLIDLMSHLRHSTQIIYPKDAAWLIYRLNLRAGCCVVEAGTGSGAMTTALAWAVAPTGRVISYEARPESYDLARRNLERVGMLPFVEMRQQRLQDSEVEQNVDAFFLDVREPWKHLDIVVGSLRRGGFFAGFVPTTNQVVKTIEGLELKGFVDIAVEELLLRGYKPVPERLRPEDSMIAHTGFLISGRCLAHLDDVSRWHAKDKQRRRARLRSDRRLQAQAEERLRQEQNPDSDGGKKYPKLPLPD